MPLLHEITNEMQRKFIKNDIEFRKLALQRYEDYFTHFYNEVWDKVAPETEQEGEKVRELSLSKAETEEKEQALASINEIFSIVANYFARLHIACEHAEKNIGACQEVARVSLAILMELYGLGHAKKLSLESIGIFMPNGMNHELLVINRDPGGNLEKAEEWGGNCLIFDPHQKIIYCPANIPGLALSMSRTLSSKDGYSIRVQASNNLGLSDLDQWAQHLKFGKITAIYQDFISQYCKQKLHEMIEPWLSKKILASSFINGKTELCVHKSFLIQYLENKSALSFIGVQTEDWHTHHFACLPGPVEQEKAAQLQKQFPKHASMTTLKDYGNVLFFANTNIGGGSGFCDAVSRVIKDECSSETNEIQTLSIHKP